MSIWEADENRSGERSPSLLEEEKDKKLTESIWKNTQKMIRKYSPSKRNEGFFRVDHLGTLVVNEAKIIIHVVTIN